MAMVLPGWLVTALNFIGYEWPSTNEDTLRAWETGFSDLARKVATAHADFDGATAHLASCNEGPGIEAFVTALRSPDSNLDGIENFKRACEIASGACGVCAGIVVVMKGAVIAQLIIMAVSLASGPGALVVKQAVKWAVQAAINVVVDRVLNGVMG